MKTFISTLALAATAGALTQLSSRDDCVDTTTTDSFGDGCDWYRPSRVRFCGIFDDDDFIASEMCCTCIADRADDATAHLQLTLSAIT